MTVNTQHRQLLADICGRREAELDLARVALLVAREEYPDLDVDTYVDKLDRMAGELGGRIEIEDGAPAAVRALNRYLFDDMGFRGNEADYFNPRNSFLNDVLDRRSGIPITLSLVYLEVGRRLGLPVEGVGLPGHFIVKYAGESGPILVDPFNRGALLSREDCHERVRAIYGPAAPFRESFLAAATPRQILSRMLYNLKGIYLRDGKLDKALGIIELLLALTPWDLEEIRDRGMIGFQLRAIGRAKEDLETYLEHCPEAADAAAIRQTLEAIRALQRGG